MFLLKKLFILFFLMEGFSMQPRLASNLDPPALAF